MYKGRDMTALSMMGKTDWDKQELTYFHHALTQILPYLNEEGTTILREINAEMHNRSKL
ncbi:hypothetical protein [Aquibacillus saliphilus]|uniref:hypothetical protein n=1 Tax=Aquibacillus saliphilus TaxID=1909422 RepID=UPI001CF02B35|nr:hypothetical protein [Aquibacillus saliphilus]